MGSAIRHYDDGSHATIELRLRLLPNSAGDALTEIPQGCSSNFLKWVGWFSFAGPGIDSVPDGTFTYVQLLGGRLFVLEENGCPVAGQKPTRSSRVGLWGGRGVCRPPCRTARRGAICIPLGTRRPWIRGAFVVA